MALLPDEAPSLKLTSTVSSEVKSRPGNKLTRTITTDDLKIEPATIAGIKPAGCDAGLVTVRETFHQEEVSTRKTKFGYPVSTFATIDMTTTAEELRVNCGKQDLVIERDETKRDVKPYRVYSSGEDQEAFDSKVVGIVNETVQRGLLNEPPFPMPQSSKAAALHIAATAITEAAIKAFRKLHPPSVPPELKRALKTID